MRSANHDILTIEAHHVHETDSAWLVEIDGEQHWVPKSQCEFDGCYLQIPQWLADKKGIS